MYKIGDKIMPKHIPLNWEYQSPLGLIKEVKRCPVLIRTEYLVEFENGETIWINQSDIKEVVV